MKIKNRLAHIIVFSSLSILSTVSLAENGVYLGAGLSKLNLDEDSSVNLSITAGYQFKQWQFESSPIQSISLAIETQYADSISNTDNASHYAVFAAVRAHFSEQWYLKFKQGFSDFPDATLTNNDAESSHLGVGVGLGYQTNSGNFEFEYNYPNKTLHASQVEISYKIYF